jgi:copper chaperone CopZ
MKPVFFLFPLWAVCLISCESGGTERTFFVEGNCEACQSLIESSVREMEGVLSASWDFEASQVTVIFDQAEQAEDRIQQALAEKGFNTAFFDANPKARLELPACCQEPLQRQLESGDSPHPH